MFTGVLGDVFVEYGGESQVKEGIVNGGCGTIRITENVISIRCGYNAKVLNCNTIVYYTCQAIYICYIIMCIF